MTENNHKPLALDKVDYVIWGTGNPGWGDPRTVCYRMFSNHILWLCHQKPMSATEIAEELNVPTVYVEEELEILAKGENGRWRRIFEEGKPKSFSRPAGLLLMQVFKSLFAVSFYGFYANRLCFSFF